MQKLLFNHSVAKVFVTCVTHLDYVCMIDLYNNPMKSAGSKDYFSFFAALYVIVKKTAILFKVFMTFSLKFLPEVIKSYSKNLAR